MTLSDKQKAELEALNNLADEEIDLSDAPEVTDWSNAFRGYHRLHAGLGPPKAPDITEKGLESLITNSLVNQGWIQSTPEDFDRAYCVDLNQLTEFLNATQPDTASALSLDEDTPTRRQFLNRLKEQVSARGIIEVLRNSIGHQQHQVSLFYGTPTPGNTDAQARYLQNRFSVTRQLRYSNDAKLKSLDLGLFINGLPIATMELKNRFTGQTIANAVTQYQQDRNPRDDIFRLGRCAVHFAVDDEEVKFCTELKGKNSIFLPFNKGRDGGAGNPVNPTGIRTAYLWEQILAPDGLTDILENYAQKAGNTQIWPRYHQLEVVRKTLADARQEGAGQRYLIQHSAGSGKSNSIAWLARQLIGITKDSKPVFDSIIIITDRRILDTQINRTIRQFTQVNSTVGHAENSGDLRRFITEGKKIIVTTVQKFPFILDDIGSDHRDGNFAIIIDEAHSSQGGRTSGAMSAALGESSDDDVETAEDQINQIIERRKMLPNASYFAFTATPKNKTLEMFGYPDPQPDGTTRHLPFHNYSMKQAIEEGFITDVLSNYTPVDRYFSLVKNIEDDPQFDSRRAQRKLRKYVESHPEAIQEKAEIMVEHFHESVFLPRKMDGQARAMVVTDGVDRAIGYYNAIRELLSQRGVTYRALVAFSGNREYNGQNVGEAQLNGFPESRTADYFQKDPYRILICADKFQTGYDEPLLHTMYVDKTLAGIKAVQTLSRLNRAHPKKYDTFVLDFMNSTEVIQESFADYYRTTILSDETDANKLHDLKGVLDQAQVYSDNDIEGLVDKWLKGEDRTTFEPVLEECVERYTEMSEDEQVKFKGSAKSFTRLYAFLSQLLPYSNAGWEKLSIFLNLLIPKLPAPVEEDLSLGILEAVDMDTYRAEKQATISIKLEDEDAEIDPVQGERGGGLQDTQLEFLSIIIDDFNRTWGNSFTNPEEVGELIKNLPDKVEADNSYQNAVLHSDKQNAQIEHNAAMKRQVTSSLRTNTEFYKKYNEDRDFQRWLNEIIFNATYSRLSA